MCGGHHATPLSIVFSLVLASALLMAAIPDRPGPAHQCAGAGGQERDQGRDLRQGTGPSLGLAVPARRRAVRRPPAGDRARRPPAPHRQGRRACRRPSLACRRSSRKGRAACWTWRSIRNSRANGWIYLAYAEPRDGNLNGTTVARARLVLEGTSARLADVKIIFRQDPSGTGGLHFGCRLVFADDGMLFVTLGERFQKDYAQDVRRSWGKVVRIAPDGAIPEDNPRFGAHRRQGAVDDRAPQSASRSAASRNAQAVGRRARPQGRRRGQRHRARPQLRLAGDRLWHRLLRRETPRGYAQGRHGAAGLLLAAFDRAIGHGVLHGRQIPAVEGQPVRRRVWPASISPASCSMAKRSSARRSC